MENVDDEFLNSIKFILKRNLKRNDFLNICRYGIYLRLLKARVQVHQKCDSYWLSLKIYIAKGSPINMYSTFLRVI